MKVLSLSAALCVIVLVGCNSNKTDSTASESLEASVETKAVDKTEALKGAWTTAYTDDSGKKVTATAILAGRYMAETFYNVEEKRFDMTMGGSWSTEGNTFTLTYEFHSRDSAKVGTTQSAVYNLNGDKIKFEAEKSTWKRVDDGTPGALNNAYLITGRKRDGKISKRTPGERKTMKILSGTRFQWIAFHTGTGKFSGTGGGTYTAENGDYVENIEFFSKDGSRVGASLPFKYELVEEEWHHSGLSSKGSPIYEIWTPRSILDEDASK
ncbi:MAG: membrane or secreted protein [Cyclobacteriaceae bacterium]